MKLPAPPKRAYRQGARAAAAEETATRITDAFAARLRESWFDEITLEQVARDAGVTVPTIIRRFTSKEGLLDATWKRLADDFQSRRAVAPGDAVGVVAVIMAEYEYAGDLVMRAVAQEGRYAAFKRWNDFGRREHRRWVEDAFAPQLAPFGKADRTKYTDQLVAALDLYIWQLVRRDMGRSLKHTQGVMLDLLNDVLRRMEEQRT
jgi:AcrR family transcriptional regulator